jgi:DNA repair exonuclease SbcCD ATPase subunit
MSENHFDDEELSSIKNLIDQEGALGERTLEEFLDAMQKIKQIRNKADEAIEEADESSTGIRNTIKLMRNQQKEFSDKQQLIEKLEEMEGAVESHLESIEEDMVAIRDEIQEEVLPELEEVKGLTGKEIEGLKRAENI